MDGQKQTYEQFKADILQWKDAHREEYTASHPEHAQDQKIFEAWVIQKIAGLQLSVEHLADALNRHLKVHKGA